MMLMASTRPATSLVDGRGLKFQFYPLFYLEGAPGTDKMPEKCELYNSLRE